jgi:hypothetical protein
VEALEETLPTALAQVAQDLLAVAVNLLEPLHLQELKAVMEDNHRLLLLLQLLKAAATMEEAKQPLLLQPDRAPEVIVAVLVSWLARSLLVNKLFVY